MKAEIYKSGDKHKTYHIKFDKGSEHQITPSVYHYILHLTEENKRMDKELDIVHEALTEIYNMEVAEPIVKKCLNRIDELKP